jgi:hypothetical protein
MFVGVTKYLRKTTVMWLSKSAIGGPDLGRARGMDGSGGLRWSLCGGRSVRSSRPVQA